MKMGLKMKIKVIMKNITIVTIEKKIERMKKKRKKKKKKKQKMNNLIERIKNNMHEILY